MWGVDFRPLIFALIALAALWGLIVGAIWGKKAGWITFGIIAFGFPLLVLGLFKLNQLRIGRKIL